MRRAGLPVPDHRLQKPDRQHEESLENLENLENLESQESKRGKQKQTSKVYLGRFGPKLFHEQACGCGIATCIPDAVTICCFHKFTAQMKDESWSGKSLEAKVEDNKEEIKAFHMLTVNVHCKQ